MVCRLHTHDKSSPLTWQKTQLCLTVWFQVTDSIWLLPCLSPEVFLPHTCLVGGAGVNSSWEVGHSEFRATTLGESVLS